jgi:hypothetical protein
MGTSLLADAVEGDYGGVADLEPLAEGVLNHGCAEGQCEWTVRGQDAGQV